VPIVSLASALMAAIAIHGQGQDASRPVLDAAASDPVVMGWMEGSPVPPDKQIRFSDESFLRFPQTRWSFSNIRQLMPTSVVARGDSTAVPLARAERSDLDGVTFQPIGSSETMTWAQSLAANYTDGIVVLHRGRIVYERYFGVLQAHEPHIAFSVTKSFVATVAAALVAEGVIDERAQVASYVPELKSTGFADATIRQLLDMTTGLDYSEVYTDRNSAVWQFTRAGGFLPRPAGDQGPGSFYEYLQTVKKASPHGERFAYKTVNTDALGWVLRRVTGKSLSSLLRERIWSKLGVEQDGFFTVDATGVEFAGGGLNLTLRDMARFGEMMRLGGRYNGQQIVPASVVDDVRRGGNREHFAPAGYKTLPGWSYRTMWWVSHNDHGAYTARGVHGQGIYVDPKAEMVIARFASHPMAGNVNLDPTSLPAYDAIAKHLMAAGNPSSRSARAKSSRRD
jgi:CubicO group peptidase (beta-lactamase class C family)